MVTKVTYTCDRCKKDQLGRQENGGHTPLYTISIICEPLDTYRTQFYTPVKYQSAEWCKECVVELQVTRPLLRADEHEKASPTMEDIVREIIRQEREES